MYPIKFPARSFFALSLVVFGLHQANAQTPVVYNSVALTQPVNDLIYAPTRRVIYASVPSTGGIYGNHIIAIDPFTRQITGSVFVGSEPNKLAISHDDEFLYVGLDGAASVRKVILDTLTADIMFGLGSGSFGLHYPEDIVVLPNQPNVIAVSRRNLCCSPRHEGVAIYENGVMRPTATPGHTGSNVIEPGDTETVLYGYNNETTDFGFRRMSVSASGVSITSNLQQVISGFGVDIKFSGGLVYSSTGRIVNPITNTLHGTLAVQGSTNGFVPDAKSNRVFFLSGATLSAFNSSNFQPAGTQTLSIAGQSSAKLIRWGRRGFAYRTSDSRVVIFETSLVPAQPNTSDFNGDELADFAVFRPSGGLWYSTSGIYAYPFGIASDIPVASDYDGDNKTDIAVFREGVWYTLRSSTQTFSAAQFGLATDRPVPADFDGDHKSDLAVYRDGVWYVLRSSDSQVLVATFGLVTDDPVPADFDGDGRTDFAVFRPASGTWYVLTSVTNQFQATQFGSSSGRPAPADYDGDGKSDLAVWQNTFGQPVYYVLSSRNSQVSELVLTADDASAPFPADFDGDGVADACVFAQTGEWTVRASRSGQILVQQFGTFGDRLINGR